MKKLSMQLFVEHPTSAAEGTSGRHHADANHQDLVIPEIAARFRISASISAHSRVFAVASKKPASGCVETRSVGIPTS
jgi:hypothetical protein